MVHFVLVEILTGIDQTVPGSSTLLIRVVTPAVARVARVREGTVGGRSGYCKDG